MRYANALVLLLPLLLQGCATKPEDRQSLEQAQQAFLAVKSDNDVLRVAPKDVIRSGESLARADRLSSYWGGDADMQHYAYLSQRYSQIAREHTDAALNAERLQREQLELERLQLTLRESKLLSVAGNGDDEQMFALAAAETDRGLVMTLGDVLFDTGRADLKASANRTVLKLVQFLQNNPRRVVRIEGYTDTKGDAAFNLQLSKDRAQSVADVLIDLGIDPQRISVRGFGEAYPLAENASSRGRALNRRVEIVFSDANGKLGMER